MALETGTKLGPYEIVSQLGAGGMGEVYKARDTRLDRTVAVKVLPPTLSANPESRQRFEREAKAVSSLNHPHICTLHDIGAYKHFCPGEQGKRRRKGGSRGASWGTTRGRQGIAALGTGCSGAESPAMACLPRAPGLGSACAHEAGQTSTGRARGGGRGWKGSRVLQRSGSQCDSLGVSFVIPFQKLVTVGNASSPAANSRTGA